MGKETVCVLMSAYNGEKYITDQIESIINQEGVSVSLLVRDDGSTDGTLEILEKYKAGGILKVLPSKENYGPAKSFMELLYSAGEFSYYAFADQDDVWKSEKLLRAIEMLEKENQPALYASNQVIYQLGKEVGLRFKEIPNYTLTGIICGNLLSGCTMVFNKELRNILVTPYNRPSDEILRIRMHDTWVAAVASVSGKIVYDLNAYIDYRIHESNTVGVNAGTIHNRIYKLKKYFCDNNSRYGRSKLAKELIEISDKSLDFDVVNDFSCARFKRIALLKNDKVKKDCTEKRFLFLLKVFFRWI